MSSAPYPVGTEHPDAPIKDNIKGAPGVAKAQRVTDSPCGVASAITAFIRRAKCLNKTRTWPRGGLWLLVSIHFILKKKKKKKKHCVKSGDLYAMKI